jgi:hypothetical protein
MLLVIIGKTYYKRNPCIVSLKLDLFINKETYQPGENVSGRIEYTDPLIGGVKGMKIKIGGSEITTITETRRVQVPVTRPIPGVDRDGDGRPDSIPGVDRDGDGRPDSIPGVDRDGDGRPDRPTPVEQTETINHSNSETLYSREVQLDPKSPSYFEFKLPTELMESYTGRHAKISYSITAEAETFGLNKTDNKSFNIIVKDQNPGDPVRTFINGKKGVVESVVEVPKSRYSRGETIAGTIKIRNLDRGSIQKGEIVIRGLEYAMADNISRSSIIEEYKTNIVWDSDNTGSFNFSIPNTVHRTYEGKYSKYTWEIEQILETGFSSSDIKAKNSIVIT